jgi:hypothetical protein
VPEQQQQQLQQLLTARTELDRSIGKTALLQSQELTRTEVCSAITAANCIGSSTGTSVLLRGPGGCGKHTAVRQVYDGVADWCKQQAKPSPASCIVWPYHSVRNSAGVYGAILQVLKLYTSLKIEKVSKNMTEAKQQLETLLFETTTSSSSSSHVLMIVVTLLKIDEVDVRHAQQLLEWAHTAGCKLILIGTDRSDLAQTLPRPQHLVVLQQFTESDVLDILNVQAGAAVLPAANALCANCASGDVGLARAVCQLAIDLALVDRNESSVVTVDRMEQAVCRAKLK